MERKPETIAVLGGTGALGSGIVYRLARAGYRVIVGSRDATRAAEAAAETNARVGRAACEGAGNLDAAARAGMVILAVPYATHDTLVGEIAGVVDGKIVVDTTVPLVPPKVSVTHVLQTGSAAVRAASMLGEKVKVVSALQNVAADKLSSDESVDCDILVTSDDAEARAAVATLIGEMGLRAIEAGPLANSIVAEALTSVLIGINRRMKVSGAGIRLTGIPG
jgi:NADPH-dependent F420 reductase